ncbi:MAG: methyltransferase domain-containing protein [Cyanobacteria bacterium P01_G01_bin.54]
MAATPSTPICLHVGCGLVVGQSWLNVDASPSLRLVKLPLMGGWLQQRLNLPPWSPQVRYGNIVQGLAIAPRSCELIYASHVLEHLSRQDFERAMQRIWGYLQPGGTFRAVVPDLEGLARDYCQALQDPAIASQAADTFMQLSCLGHPGSRATLRQRLRDALANHRHQWMWDRASLTEAFTAQGFTAVRVCPYRDWPDARFAEVEHEESLTGAIAVQGQKPRTG